MDDYSKLYLLLFNETTKAIDLLQNAQRIAEEIFINGSCATQNNEIKESPAKLTLAGDVETERYK